MLIVAGTFYLVFAIFDPQDKSAYYEALTIYAGVVLATAMSAWAEYKQELQLLKIADEINNSQATVFRGDNGKKRHIPVKELVVGDIISV